MVFDSFAKSLFYRIGDLGKGVHGRVYLVTLKEKMEGKEESLVPWTETCSEGDSGQ